MSQKLDFIHPELALEQSSIQLLLSQKTKYQPQVFCMFLMGPGIDKYVVYEDYDKLIQEWS